jgi:hypothetical protein
MTGYVRKDTTNNIADGNVINAADLDNEFDGIQDAFNASTGHNHDGTSGEGAPITALGPTQDVTISATLVAPKTTNTVDIGSSALKFKDLFLAGNGSIGGTLAVTGVATFTAQPILSSLTASRAVFSDGSKGLVSNAITGTGNVVMSASPTLTGTIDAAALTASGAVTLSGGTANGVAYLNGSKVVTSGSALTFDGTTLGVGANINLGTTTRYIYATSSASIQNQTDTGSFIWAQSNGSSEVMRLTSTGLGIGTSSPAYKLDSRVTTSASVVSAINLDASGNNNGDGSAVNFSRAGNALSGVARISAVKAEVSNNETDLVFSNFAAGSLTEKMRIVGATGNVGIGTSSPSNKLVLAESGATSVYQQFLNNSSGNIGYIGLTSGGTYVLQTNNSMTFSTGASYTERMRLDSSGNLGLGVTPSAWGGGFSGVLEVKNAGSALASGGSGNTSLWANSYYTSGVLKYAANGLASNYTQDSGQHIWSTAPNNTSGAGATLTFTQAMTLDASGNLGLGATSISTVGSYRLMEINGTTGGMLFMQTAGSRVLQLYGASSESGLWMTANGPLTFGTNNAERARIDSSGNLLVGSISNAPAGTQAQLVNKWSGGSKWGASFDQTVSSATQYTHINFSTNGTTVGYINANNSITTYNSVSDYRLKTVIGAVSGSGERIDALEPIEYEWKVDGSRTRGFLAHKFQEVYAGSVSGDKDAVDANGNPVYQAMQASTSEVIADLVAEIQSLRKRLADAGI